MRDGMRRLGLALVLGLLCGTPALAQGPDRDRDRDRAGSRPWSDPPVKPVEAPALPQAAGPAAPATAGSPHLAAEPRTVAKPRAAVARPAGRARLAAKRRAGPPRIAARATRGAEASPARRVAGAPPRTAAPRPVRYAPPPDLQEPTDLWIDARADRIRNARDGGYLVMRRTTIEDAAGRRMQILRPLDDEDD